MKTASLIAFALVYLAGWIFTANTWKMYNHGQAVSKIKTYALALAWPLLPFVMGIASLFGKVKIEHD